MKNNLALLLFLILAVFVLSACGTRIEISYTNFVADEGSLSYDATMFLNRREPIEMLKYNYVIVTAPRGSELSYYTDSQDITVSGDGTNILIIKLKAGSPLAEISVVMKKCADGNCPTEVHFEHYALPPY